MTALRHTLDRIDLRMLRLLQLDGRISNVELARGVGLSPAPSLARTRKLERAGFIRGYRAELNPDLLGLSLLAFVEMKLDRTTPEALDKFKRAIELIPEVEECHMVAGGFDYLVKMRCPDMGAYRRILGEKISAISGVRQTHTYVVMEVIKSHQALNI